jgi:hypothetical protein
MKTCTIFRPRKYGPIQKVLLVSILIGAILVVLQSVNWAYHKIQGGVGEEAAQVTVALQVVVVLILIMTGLGLAYLMDWAIRRQRFIFRTPPQQGSCAEAIVRIWGYDVHCQEETDLPAIPALDLPINAETYPILPEKPKRRGRKPTFPLDRWLPIAAKWESRDPILDAFTLGELIAEHLGTNPDGTPIVSEQTYYTTWRPRAIKELQRRAEARQKAFGSKNQNGSTAQDSKF